VQVSAKLIADSGSLLVAVEHADETGARGFRAGKRIPGNTVECCLAVAADPVAGDGAWEDKSLIERRLRRGLAESPLRQTRVSVG